MDAIIDSKPRVCFEFEVEKIIGVSSDGNYQVQWAPAWVSKFHLVGCEHLIQQFLLQQSHKNIKHNKQREIEYAVPRSPLLKEKQHESAAVIKENFGTCITNSDAVEYYDGSFLPCTVERGSCYGPPQIGEEQPTFENSLDMEMNGDAGFYRSGEGRQQYRYLPSNGGKPEPKANFVPSNSEHQFNSLNQIKGIDVDNSSVDMSQNNLHLVPVEMNIKTETSDEQVKTDTTLPELIATPMIHISLNRTECGDEVSTDDPSSTAGRSQKLHRIHANNSEMNINKIPNSMLNSNVVVGPLTCCYCKKTFTRRYSLQQHIRIHTGKRHSYPCLYCHSKFTRRDNLKRHLLTHSGKKHYYCAHCGKSFTQKGTLNTHMFTHTSRDHSYEQGLQANKVT